MTDTLRFSNAARVYNIDVRVLLDAVNSGAVKVVGRTVNGEPVLANDEKLKLLAGQK